MKPQKKTLLIDGDIFIFRAALLSEHAVEWTEDLWTLHAHKSDAVVNFDNAIEDLKEDLGATDVIIALSDPVNFRYTVLPTYKHNRKDKRPPLLRQAVKEYVQERHTCYIRPQLEGDDILGILATSDVIIKGEKIVVSIDKDMHTIPCTYYNSDNKTLTEITTLEAQYYHLLQTLTGDASDGYAGCPGIGPKTAEKLLDGMLQADTTVDGWYMPYWEIVVKAYEKAKLTEQDALTQARVARICRKDDYDFQKKEVILWTPQKEV